MTSFRKFNCRTLVIASHNNNKLVEINSKLKNFSINLLSAKNLGLSAPAESGNSFCENATIKALCTARATNMPALADDSGLVVSALNGRPGIHSSRFSGPKNDFRTAMKRIMHDLRKTEDKSAHFICALCLAWPDEHLELFQGKVSGSLVWPMRGTYGFGYDPIFQPNGFVLTFAEIEPSIKNKISHRAIAFSKLISACFDEKKP